MMNLGLSNRIERVAATLIAIVTVIHIASSFVTQEYAQIYPVDMNTETLHRENGIFLLLLFCLAVVLYMVILSLIKNPASWFFLTLSLAIVWVSGDIAFNNLNALVYGAPAIKMSGSVVSVRPATGRRAIGNVITFDVYGASSSSSRYTVNDKGKLFKFTEDGRQVDFYLCEGYFHKSYACNKTK